MIPIAKMTYTSTVADTQRVRYHCEACGADSDAVVSAVSQGYAEAVYFVGMKQASSDAASAAVTGLPSALRRTLGLAGCPKCGARDRDERRRAILGAIAPGAFGRFAVWLTVPLILVAIAGVSYAVDAMSIPSFGVAGVSIAALALFVAFTTGIRYGRTAREASTLVVWEDEVAT